MDYHFETTGLTPDEIARLHETHQLLKSHFSIETTGHIDFHLENFSVFNNYLNFRVHESYVTKSAGDSCYVLFVETQSASLKPSRTKLIESHKEYQTWALVYLKHNMGRVMIRPETIRDKIIELLLPIELDFKEDKAFSDTFYVVADDVQKAIPCIDRNFRNAVMDIREDDFVIEIFENTLIIGNGKPVSPERAVHLAEFVVRLVG